MKGSFIKLTVLFFGLILFSLPVVASAGKQVIIDPGHGGDFTGTTGFSGNQVGYYEKDANLDVALKLRNILENQGFKVNMTRESDKDFASSSSADLAARMKVANGFINSNNDNTVFISIHHNSIPSDPSMRGYETYYYDARQGISSNYPPDPIQIGYATESRRFAVTMHNAFLGHAPVSEGRGIIERDFYVTRNAQVPAILTELGYMSNPDEERLIRSDAYQKKEAKGLAIGINKYFEVFVVYDHKDKILKTYKSKNRALAYAKSRENVYVFDKDRQKVIYKDVDANYEVHHSVQGLIHDAFVTEKKAIAYAKKWKNTKVINKKTGEMLWSNYLNQPYSVEHSHQGVLFESFNSESAIAYAKKWKNTAVIDNKTGEVIWSNYLNADKESSKSYSVEHSSQGEMYSTNNPDSAIAYAKKWKHTAVINNETGEIIWSNYLDVATEEDQGEEKEAHKSYSVEHSSQGNMYSTNNSGSAIAYAKKWKHTAVIDNETGEVIWSNYLEKTYSVKHSSQGVLFKAYSKGAAIDYAKKWKHTAVVNNSTEKVIWSNYL